MRIGGVTIGRPAERRRWPQHGLHKDRVKAARRNTTWTEIQEDDLVARDGGRVIVSVDSDAVFKHHRGVVWERASTGAIADRTPLYWYLRKLDGEMVFLEREPGTWSDHVRRQEQRIARRRAETKA